MPLSVDKSIRKAKSLIKRGQFAEAESIYLKLLKKYPKSNKALQGRNELRIAITQNREHDTEVQTDYNQDLIDLFNKGNIDELIYRGLILKDSFPYDARLLRIMGTAYLQLDKLNDAIQFCRQAISIYSEDADAHNSLGTALRRKGDLNGAIESFRCALLINPHNARIFFNMGNALHEQGNINEAIESYTNAINIDPNFAEAYNNIADSQIKNGQIDAAIESYKKAVAKKPAFLEAYCNLGAVLAQKGDLDGAIDSYDRALAVDASFFLANLHSANLMSDKRELNRSIALFEKAIQIKPDSYEAYYGLGQTNKHKGDIREALTNLKKALDIDANENVYYAIGEANEAIGDWNRAADSYKSAVELAPGFIAAFNNLGNVYLADNKRDLAINSYKQALEINYNYAEAHNNLATAKYYDGDLTGAIENVKSAINIDSDHADYHSKIGALYYHRGSNDFGDSLKSFEQALILDAKHKVTWSSISFPMKIKQANNPASDRGVLSWLDNEILEAAPMDAALLEYRLLLGSQVAQQGYESAIKALAGNEILIHAHSNDYGCEMHTPVVEFDRIIALEHFGRSGTGLLHSLLDGHPEVCSLPSIYFTQFFDPCQWEKLSSGGLRDIVDRFITAYPVLFDAKESSLVATGSNQFIARLGEQEGMTQVGEHGNEALALDRNQFRDSLNQYLANCDKLDALRFFNMVHRAYDKILKNRLNKSVMFYHIHNADVPARLNFIRVAPDAQWLVMVREPLQSCESWVKDAFKANDYQTVTDRIISMLYKIDDVAYRNQHSVGVRLEDLKNYPEETLGALTKWMDIEVQESLYTMTAQGKRWWGDRSSPDLKDDNITPFNKASIQRKIGCVFSERDQFILQTLFYPFSAQFDYAEMNVKQFKKDLSNIEPLIEQMFDFEKSIAENTQVDPKNFMNSGSYRYFRTCMAERWETLSEFNTYPDMLKPLVITGIKDD